MRPLSQPVHQAQGSDARVSREDPTRERITALLRGPRRHSPSLDACLILGPINQYILIFNYINYAMPPLLPVITKAHPRICVGTGQMSIRQWELFPKSTEMRTWSPSIDREFSFTLQNSLDSDSGCVTFWSSVGFLVWARVFPDAMFAISFFGKWICNAPIDGLPVLACGMK